LAIVSKTVFLADNIAGMKQVIFLGEPK